MKRKKFIQDALMMGLATGGLAAFPKRAAAKTPGGGQASTDKQEAERKFREAWIETLMKNMEATLDEPTRHGLMESCGRACARRSSILKLAEGCRGDVAKFMKTMAQFLGEEGNFISGDVVSLTYPKCYCELVAEGPARLPETYCHCSEGWVKEVFEKAAGKKVAVETVQTIKRGAESCKFTIKI